MRQEYNLYKKEYKRKNSIYIKIWLILCFLGLLVSVYYYGVSWYVSGKAKDVYNELVLKSNEMDSKYPCERIHEIVIDDLMGCDEKRRSYKLSQSLQSEIDNIRIDYEKIDNEAKENKSTSFIVAGFAIGLTAVVLLVFFLSIENYDSWVEKEKKYLNERLEHQKLKNDLYRAENEYEIIPVEHEGEILRLRNQKIREILNEQLQIDEYLHQIQRLKARRGLNWDYYEKELQDIEIQSKKIENALKSMPLRELELKIREYETVIKPRIDKVLNGVRGRLDDYEG